MFRKTRIKNSGVTCADLCAHTHFPDLKITSPQFWEDRSVCGVECAFRAHPIQALRTVLSAEVMPLVFVLGCVVGVLNSSSVSWIWLPSSLNMGNSQDVSLEYERIRDGSPEPMMTTRAGPNGGGILDRNDGVSPLDRDRTKS
jgi:hypothetical protein